MNYNIYQRESLSENIIKISITPTKIYLEPDQSKTKITSKLIIDRSNMKIQETKEKIDIGYPSEKIFGILGIFDLNGKSIVLYVEEVEEIAVLEKCPLYKITKLGFIQKKQKDNEIDQQYKEYQERLKIFFNNNSFYFSYGIDLTNSNSHQLNRFWWNHDLCKQFPIEWQLKVIQGYIGYFSTTIKSLQILDYYLISRKSYFKNGTIKNDTGIDQEGNVSNYVETQQILYLNKNENMSQIFCRGSIPLFWQYDILTNQIIIQKEDHKKALLKHEKILSENYQKIHFINLIDDGSQLQNLLEKYIIECQKMNYYKLNFKDIFLNEKINDINLFISQLEQFLDYNTLKQQQQNIFRINCYDCLEQTNIFMSKLAVLGLQKIMKEWNIDIEKEFNTNCLNENFDQISIHKMHPFLLQLKQKWDENGENIKNSYKVKQKRCDLNQFYKNLLEEKSNQEIIYKFLGLTISEMKANEKFLMLEKMFSKRENEYVLLKNITLYVVSWNINGHQPNDTQYYNQLFQFQIPPSIVVVGFQELVALNTLTVVGKQNKEIVEKWKQIISNCLNTKGQYILAAQQVMVGIYTLIFVLEQEQNHITNVKTDIVKYGFGQQLGNKGGVLIKLLFYDSYICFINVHLPAGQKSNDDRMCAFDYIHNRAELNTHDWVITFGDMNFRINLPQQQVVQDLQKFKNALLKEEKEIILKKLKENDQLRTELQKSTNMKKFSEANILFLPTYKFDIGTEIYDTIKKRVPSYTDRILYRKIQKVQILQVEKYECLQGNFQVSDHRPICCQFKTQVRQIDLEKKEQLFQELYKIEQDIIFDQQYFPKLEIVKNFDQCIKFRSRVDNLKSRVTMDYLQNELLTLCDPEKNE